MNADSHAVVSDRMNKIDMMSKILFIMSILSKTPNAHSQNAPKLKLRKSSHLDQGQPLVHNYPKTWTSDRRKATVVD